VWSAFKFIVMGPKSVVFLIRVRIQRVVARRRSGREEQMLVAALPAAFANTTATR